MHRSSTTTKAVSALQLVWRRQMPSVAGMPLGARRAQRAQTVRFGAVLRAAAATLALALAIAHASIAAAAPLTAFSGQTTHATPGMTLSGGIFYVAYAGDDAGSCQLPCRWLHITDSSNNYATQSRINDTARLGTGVGTCTFNGLPYLVWAGSDNPSHIYIGYFNGTTNLSNHAAIPQVNSYDTTASTPACASYNGRLYVLWRGPDNVLRVKSSADGLTWNASDRWVLTESSSTGPALAAGAFVVNGQTVNRLYILWAGTDNNHSLNWGYFDPSCPNKGACALLGKQTGGNGTDQDVGAAVFSGELYISWRVPALDDHLRVAGVFPSTILSPNFTDTSNAGIAIATSGAGIFGAWGGTDSAGTLNVAQLLGF